MNNTHRLLCLIQIATESAREEIDNINLRLLEETLPEAQFKPLFDAICTIDETQKVIAIAVKELIDGKPELKVPFDIDEVFDTEKTVFRLFYMIRDKLNRWIYQNRV